MYTEIVCAGLLAGTCSTHNVGKEQREVSRSRWLPEGRDFWKAFKYLLLLRIAVRIAVVAPR